jgi:cyclophilin family peptidyl-prolyl cis-trans isomerase
MDATASRTKKTWVSVGSGTRLAALLVLTTLFLAACGSKDESGSDGATVAAPTEAAANADVASGCWKATDRGQASGSDNTPLQWKQPPASILRAGKHYTATLTTNKGAFDVEFYSEDAPNTVNNFVCLAKAGYYDNTPFHRILSDFVIQGGDPTGTGRGGPGYEFPDEPIKRTYDVGTLAMANAGPNTNGSQFFVVVGQSGTELPPNYTIFGKVTEGMDVVNAIAQTPTKVGDTREKSVPVEPIVLQSVTVAES